MLRSLLLIPLLRRPQHSFHLVRCPRPFPYNYKRPTHCCALCKNGHSGSRPKKHRHTTSSVVSLIISSRFGVLFIELTSSFRFVVSFCPQTSLISLRIFTSIPILIRHIVTCRYPRSLSFAIDPVIVWSRPATASFEDCVQTSLCYRHRLNGLLTDSVCFDLLHPTSIPPVILSPRFPLVLVVYRLSFIVVTLISIAVSSCSCLLLYRHRRSLLSMAWSTILNNAVVHHRPRYYISFALTEYT